MVHMEMVVVVTLVANPLMQRELWGGANRPFDLIKNEGG